MLVTRNYDEPDLINSVQSSESSSIPGCFVRQPFTHNEIIRMRKGSYEGVQTKDYNRKVKSGSLIPFTYYRRYDLRVTSSGWRRITWKGSLCNGQYSTPISEIPTILLVEDLNDPALFPAIEEMEGYCARFNSDHPSLIADAAAKLWDGFDALTFLAELDKSVALLLNLRRKAKELLSRKPAAKKGSDEWLQWEYGWLGIARDIESITGALKDKFRPGIQRYHSGSSTTFRYDEIRDIVLPNKEHHYVRVRRDVEVSSIGAYAAKVGLDLDTFINPALTGWEIIPYSFVIDWFVDIGTWIKTLSTLAIVDSDTGSGGWACNYKGHYEVIRTAPGNVMDSYEAHGSCSVSAQYRARFPGEPSIFPNINFSFQSWRHLLTGVALLVQRLS